MAQLDVRNKGTCQTGNRLEADPIQKARLRPHHAQQDGCDERFLLHRTNVAPAEGNEHTIGD